MDFNFSKHKGMGVARRQFSVYLYMPVLHHHFAEIQQGLSSTVKQVEVASTDNEQTTDGLN
jgi:N-acetyl-gamma-glutamylphosphate reductase